MDYKLRLDFRIVMYKQKHGKSNWLLHVLPQIYCIEIQEVERGGRRTGK